MGTSCRILGALLLTLLMLSACKARNPFNPLLLKTSDPQYQTVTEEVKPGQSLRNGMQSMMQPMGGAPSQFQPENQGPMPPLPLLDPLTSGPALPPPPPPFDDEGIPDRPLIVVPRCGDRILEEGEECEDGNNISGDGCSDICLEEYCGNGLIEPEHGEQCDGGLTTADEPLLFPTPQAWNCDKFCRLIICGDGVVQLGGVNSDGQTAKVAEECDLGPLNGCCSGCTVNCELESPCCDHSGTEVDCTGATCTCVNNCPDK